jgi:hypothetical protein
MLEIKYLNALKFSKQIMKKFEVFKKKKKNTISFNLNQRFWVNI